MHPPTPGAYGDLGPTILGVTLAQAAVTSIVLALRAYASFRIVKSPGWDLFWAVATWVLCIAAQVILCVSVAYGLGNHMGTTADTVKPQDVVAVVETTWIAFNILLPASVLGKIAIVALILRIQGPAHRRKAWVLHFLWFSFALATIAQMIFLGLMCDPPNRLWLNQGPGICKYRIRAEHTGFIQGIWGALVDTALAIYPALVFWTYDISLKRKIGLSILMSGGVVAAVTSVLKTYYIHLAPSTPDVTYQMAPLLICSYTEAWVIILVGSIPQLRVFFLANARDDGGVGSTISPPLSTASSYKSSRTPRQSIDLPEITEVVEILPPPMIRFPAPALLLASSNHDATDSLEQGHSVTASSSTACEQV